MSALEAAALYTALNLLILLLLGGGTGMARGKHKVSIGTGGVADLECRMRAHANAAEWIPGALIGLVLLALVGAPSLLIHVVGLVLTLARAAHGLTMGLGKPSGPGRMIGTLGTVLVYVVLIGVLIWYALM